MDIYPGDLILGGLIGLLLVTLLAFVQLTWKWARGEFRE